MFSALTEKTIFQFDHEESQSDDDLLMVLDATEMIILWLKIPKRILLTRFNINVITNKQL
jgi:hypothetical protein